MSRKILTLMMIGLFLYACGPASAEPTVDVNAIHTAAAKTVWLSARLPGSSSIRDGVPQTAVCCCG